MFLATSSDCQVEDFFNRILWGRKENFLWTSSRVLATCEWAFVVWHLLQRRLSEAELLGGWPGRRWWDSIWGASCEESKSASCVTDEGWLKQWNLQHVFVLPKTWPPQCWWYQDLRMPFFLSWCTDLKSVVTYYISHLLIHATYINIVKSLSWWINNFHNLVLVFSSVSSGILKLFQWFGVCSLTKTSGVVSLLDVFLLWSVAPYKSSVRLACSGIHELCLLPLHSLGITQYVLFPNNVSLRFGGYRHWISTIFKRTVCCINAYSYLYNYREVIDCRGCFSNSDMTHLEHPNLGRHYQLRFVPNLSVLRCSWCVRHTEGIAVVGHLFVFFNPFLLLVLVLKMLFWSVCKLLCILCMYCTLIHYFFRLI